MRLLLAGLPAREEAALGFFLDRNFKSWAWQSGAPDAGVRPAADLVVLDMAAFGWAHWSEEAQAQLLAWLQDTPAVLLVSAHDRSWSVVQEQFPSAARVWLAKPFGTQAMGVALDQAAAAVAMAPVKPAPVQSAPVQSEPTRAEPSSEEPGLSIAAFQARLALQPEDSPHAFLRLLAHRLTQTLAFEVRFTVQNSLIIHPANGWMATNTPLQVIYRLCDSDALAAAVTVRTLDDAHAEERAQRLAMPPQALETFLLHLVASTLDKRAAAPQVSRFSFT